MNNYVSTEKSLKKWLKRKTKITLGMVVAFMITGTVGFADIIADEAYNHISEKKEEINDTKYEINTSLTTKKYKQGILVNNNGELLINSKEISIVHEVKNDTEDTGYRRCAVHAKNGGRIILGNKNTDTINISTKVSADDMAVGIHAWRDTKDTSSNKSGKIEINSNQLNITAESEKGFSYGIYAYNNTTPENLGDNERAEIVINSKNVVINAISNADNVLYPGMTNSNGVIAWSQGIVKINNGNVNISAESVINTRGNSLVEINVDNNKENTVILNGDIIFAYDGNHSGTTVESGVNVNLSNENSYLNGKITPTGNAPDGKDKVTGMALGLSNGGKWEVTGDSFVNDLTMNGGILEVTDDVDNINVDRLHGNNGTALFAASVNGEEIEVTDGKLNISEVKDNTNLEVGLSGVNTDDLAEKNISTEKALEKLTNKVVGKDGVNIENIEQTLFVDGGTLTGKVTADLENGKVTNIQQAKDTPTTAAIRDLTAISYLSWKQEMSSLSQRMGELRDSSAEHGVWARVYGGKVENGSQYDNEYQTYQIGYDKKYTVDNGRVYLGYLVSYTDGETDYSYGTGENYSVGAGIYATWMNNNGHYVDVLYKVSRLNNKFDMKDVEDVKGDYDTYGISLSAEYGKRFDITDKWFAEPSVGMHLGRLGDETYTTDGGIKISQDSIYTAEGRVGAAVGYKFSDKGNVYARTHVVKEFAGDVDTEYMRNGVYASTSEDFGDTWFEFGVGVNYRFTENMNVYADIERTGDSTVETKWQGNLGFRYEF